MKLKRLLYGSAIALAACSRATSAPVETRVDRSVDLANGEAAHIENSAVVVRFGGANDSRCPSDVVCISAGEADITLLFSGAGADKVEVVHLMREPKGATYGGYRFDATALAPYPKSTAQGADKTLTLRITRAP
ncbi:MAG: hypothetical protein ABIY52_06875 [Gemmatimonadaceae bacterium]